MDETGAPFTVIDDSPKHEPAQSHLDAFNQYRSLLFSIAYRMLGEQRRGNLHVI